MVTNYNQSLELLLAMTGKELRARYKYTVFGFFWLILNPVLQMLVIGFIFTFLIKESIEHYYYFLFINLLVWNFFSQSLIKTTPSMVWERSLIKKAVFSRGIIPLSIILSNLVHFAIALLIYSFPVMLLGKFSLSSLPTLLAATSLLLGFTFGLSLLTTALNVRFRDVNFFVQAALVIWFYATPIIYPLSFIPGQYLWLWSLNPMTSILQLFQNSFLGRILPEPSIIIVNLIIIVITLWLGVIVFKKESKYFDDWL